MAKVNCSSCEDLREKAPNLFINGFGKTECNYLRNNTGISGKSDNCTDLNDMNDCFIGNMEQEVKNYETCDWKEFMRKFIPNVWTMFKAIICALCGIDTNIDKLWCWVENLAKPQNTGALTPDDSKVKYRAAHGVKSRYDPEHPDPSDAPLVIRIVGTTARITGSIRLEGTMPSSYSVDTDTVWGKYFKGQTEVKNQYGKESHDGNFPNGGYLLYEYEVKGCDWGFTTLYDAPLMPSSAGDFIARVRSFKDGDEYPYDCGFKPNEDGTYSGQIYHPSSSKYDTLIQVRLMSVNTYGITRWTENHKYCDVTPNGVTMVHPCPSAWEC